MASRPSAPPRATTGVAASGGPWLRTVLSTTVAAVALEASDPKAALDRLRERLADALAAEGKDGAAALKAFDAEVAKLRRQDGIGD